MRSITYASDDDASHPRAERKRWRQPSSLPSALGCALVFLVTVGSSASVLVTPTPFAERSVDTGDVYNASGIVSLADSRFLICDNNTNHSLFRLQLTPEGLQAGPLAMLPFKAVPAESIDDIEDLALVQDGERWHIFATASISRKNAKGGKEAAIRPSGLIRVTVEADKSYFEEVIHDFRSWLVARVPALSAAAAKSPDAGGINVEGLAWDPARRALLFGVRTPVLGQLPIVVPVVVKHRAGPWSAENFEALAPIPLQIESPTGAQGIRGMATLPDGKGFLVVVGNATSEDPSSFALYAWDGNEHGTVRRLAVTFARGMKPEGVTVGTVGGKPSVVFVDDGGGFSVVPLDQLSIPGS